MTHQKEYVVLVDTTDTPIGTMEKIKAHHEGLLHRAISVHITNKFGQILLQKRSFEKYHSPGLLSNACCSHPREGEKTIDAATRRLHEELGFSCPLLFKKSFLYKKAVGSTLIEHEFDHIFHGIYEGPINPNIDEVAEVLWVTDGWIQQKLLTQPSLFTPWFPLLYEILQQHNVS